MRPALAPVHTGERESAAQRARGFAVDAERVARPGAGGGQLVGVVVRRGREPLERPEAVVQRHRHGAGHVVVAGARGPQVGRGPRHERVVRPPGDDAQGFEGIGDAGAVQAVVAVFPLGEHLHQPLGLQPAQVHARGRRAHLAQRGQLGAGSCPAIGQRVQHPRSRRLADRRGHAGDGGVWVLDGHSLMVDEASMPRNRHHAVHACHRIAPHADQPPRRPQRLCHGGGGCDGRVRPRSRPARPQEDRDDDHLRDPLRDRSVPARRLQEVR